MSNMNKVLGFERINERRQRPNKLINFIKPREGPDKDLAQDFLERVAAICYPIMKANHLVVMSLEEYPSNKEFLGRNFNAGEIIQLVLKSPSGQWYPIKHVQMVMMHELAHCKQMNHSRDFWKVNNGFRDELKGLWGRGYCGEGLWGRGKMLLSGRFSNDSMPDAADGPLNLCGGTYRSKGGRKRKQKGDKPQLSWAEQKQRRIAKKFGVNGQALGADEYARSGLDQGRHRPSKPRVAGSKRGRELRAAAALARFDKPKQETNTTQGTSEYGFMKHEDIKQEDMKEEPSWDLQYDTETDSEDERPKLTGDWDDNNDVVKICENEDIEDEDAQHELDELREIDRPSVPLDPKQTDSPTMQPFDKASRKVVDDGRSRGSHHRHIGSDVSTDSEDESNGRLPSAHAEPRNMDGLLVSRDSNQTDAPTAQHSDKERQKVVIDLDADQNIPHRHINSDISTDSNADDDDDDDEPSNPPPPSPSHTPHDPPIPLLPSKQTTPLPIFITKSTPSTTTSPPSPTPLPPSDPSPNTPTPHPLCNICAFANPPGTPTCAMCAHVLDTRKITNWWRCGTSACKGSEYRNLGDYGRCGICGCRRDETEGGR